MGADEQAKLTARDDGRPLHELRGASGRGICMMDGMDRVDEVDGMDRVKWV